ncbi:phage portal protein [Bradyrhizobium yuanmingense]|uniref:phage portal protein n=1 Tax=Bradyrhizobium yuanmingense TaxID=108015 RepID=UPI0004B39714|nr:phage portal protein [Bradyrhizobium yuanmingense]
MFKRTTAAVPAPAEPAKTAPARRGFVSRAMNAVRSLIQSAAVNRLTGDWGTQPQPADWIVNKHQRALVARSREQLFNNDYFKAYVRLCVQNVVGPFGLVFQSKARTAGGKADKKAKAAVERAVRDWSKAKNCDVAGKLSWRGFQKHCVRGAATDGEFMLRKYVGRKFGKYGFQLQVLDPVRCPVDYDLAGMSNGGFIRHGIEFDQFGKPVAYHFVQPAANRSSDAYSYAGRWFTRIPAEEIIHGYLPEIAGQKRGLPWLSTGLFRLKQMGAFEDAAIVNARVGAAKLGVIKFAEGKGPDCNDLGDEDEMPEISGEPGDFLVLPNGADLDKFDPTYPSGEFAVFMKQCLRSIAAGGGVSYHTLAQDLENVNFSSIRQGTLDEREHFKELQEWLVEELAEPVFEGFFEQAMLRGLVINDNGNPLPASKAVQFEDHEFQGRRWEWIDPNADMKAAQGRKNNLLASPGELIRESGRDPTVVFQEIADDIKAMEEAGIPKEYIQLAFGVKITEPATDTPDEESTNGP